MASAAFRGVHNMTFIYPLLSSRRPLSFRLLPPIMKFTRKCRKASLLYFYFREILNKEIKMINRGKIPFDSSFLKTETKESELGLEEVSRVRTKEWGKEIDNNNCYVWEHIYIFWNKGKFLGKAAWAKIKKREAKNYRREIIFDEIPILFYKITTKEKIRGI